MATSFVLLPSDFKQGLIDFGRAPSLAFLFSLLQFSRRGLVVVEIVARIVIAASVAVVTILVVAVSRGDKWNQHNKGEIAFHKSSLTYVRYQTVTSLRAMIALNDRLSQTAQIRSLIHTFAKRYDVNPQLVAGIVWVESSGNPNAFRFEPKFYDKVKALPQLGGYIPKNCTLESEQILRSSSFGLMQIMGETARIRGYRGEFLTGLLDPMTNIDMGVQLFAELMKATDDPRVALFKYNAGAGAKYPGVKAGDYPSKVLAAIDQGLTAGLV